SDVLGASGKAMLRALAAGETDPVVISELARGTLRKKLGDLQLALRGEMNEAQRFVLGELLQRVNELETAEYKVGRQINQAICDREHPELFKGLGTAANHSRNRRTGGRSSYCRDWCESPRGLSD